MTRSATWRCSAFVGAVTLFVAEAAFGAGFSTVDTSVPVMAAGGTATARSDATSAASANPALGGARTGLSLAVGIGLAAPRLSANATGYHAQTESGLSTPPHLHLGYASQRWFVGGSASIPFGSRVSWPATWPRRFDLISAELTVFSFQAYGGLRFGPLSVAVGGFVDRGSLDLIRAIDFIEEAGLAELSTLATGFGFTAGAYYQRSEDWSLGLSYHSGSTLDFSGYADFTVPAEFRGRTPDQRVVARIALPHRLNLGAQISPAPRWALFADLQLVLWGSVDALVLDFAEPQTPDVVQDRQWQMTLAPRLGAAYEVLDWLTLRAGAFYDPSPTPAQTAGPSSPDSDRLGLSTGTRVQLAEAIALELAYQHVAFLGVTAEDGVRYGGVADIFGVGLDLTL